MGDANKNLVRRLVDEVINRGELAVVGELFAPELAAEAKRWFSPFRSSFPDVRMEIEDLIAEGDKVVGHFKCSGTQQGDWLGVAPTGKRFEDVDEIYVFTVKDGKFVDVRGVEDNLSRMRQLGIVPASR